MSLSQSENAVIKLDNAAGTLVSLEDKIASGGISIEHETDDAINLSDTADDHTVGMKDPGEFTMEGVYTQSRALLLMQAWRTPGDSTRTIEYNPEGAGTGDEKYTVESIMTGLSLESDESSTVMLSSTHKLTGDIAETDN
jgi:hypothetical protein